MTSDDRDPAAVTSPDRRDDDSEGSRSSSISGSPSTEKDDKPRLNIWQESLLLVVIAIVVAVVVKQLFLQAFYVPSESMEPGLQGGVGVKTDDRILVEKPSYWFGGSPKRGDVVVFKDPGGWLEGGEQPTSAIVKGMSAIGLYPSGGHLVKRVIGVGGDTIVCCDKQGRLKVNGHPVDEPYVRPGKRTGGPNAGAPCNGPMVAHCSWKVGPIPKGYVFVMGDNRAHSADSSVHMCGNATDCGDSPYVPVDDVVGKVFALAWPLNRATWISRPDAFDEVPDRPAKAVP